MVVVACTLESAVVVLKLAYAAFHAIGAGFRSVGYHCPDECFRVPGRKAEVAYRLHCNCGRSFPVS